MLGTPGGEREGPLMEAHAADAEWVLHALVRTGDEAVERDREPAAEPGHVEGLIDVRLRCPAEAGQGCGSWRERGEGRGVAGRRVDGTRRCTPWAARNEAASGPYAELLR